MAVDTVSTPARSPRSIWSRSTYFWIFPVAVFGSPGTKYQKLGDLNRASRSRQ